VVQVVEHLPNKCEALISTLSTTKKKKKEKKKTPMGEERKDTSNQNYANPITVTLHWVTVSG
jgi:hypothetical protein